MNKRKLNVLFPKFNKKIIFLISIIILAGCSQPHFIKNKEESIDLTKSIFPLGNYNQDIDYWIPPVSKGYNLPVLNNKIQNAYFSYLKSRYFGLAPSSESPWDPEFIAKKLSAEGDPGIVNIENKFLDKFTSLNSRVYGENFKERTTSWKENLKRNTNLLIDKNFRQNNRAIAVTETSVRILPTDTPAFDDFRQAGQGYPFDDLQNSSIHPGTPLYIVGASQDKAWQLVLSPSVIGWVKSDAVARVDDKFVKQWRTYANKKLGAFINEPVSVTTLQGNFQFLARIGTLLPVKESNPDSFSVLIPTRNENGDANITYATISSKDFQLIPLPTTPKNFAKLIKAMSGKPYGWGNIYFNNDCSALITTVQLNCVI